MDLAGETADQIAHALELDEEPFEELEALLDPVVALLESGADQELAEELRKLPSNRWRGKAG